MAIVVKDRVQEVTTTTGLSNFVLGGAVGGYQSFAAIGNNNVTYYAAVDPATGDWEVGIGTYSTTGPTLSRDTILSSSAAGAKVTFAAGTKNVFCTYPAGKSIYEEVAGNVLIDGGPITVIGNGVTGYTSLAAALGEMYADVNSFAQFYAQNQNDGVDASTDFVVESDLGTDTEHYADFGINSSNFSSASYPIYTPNSAYLYSIGSTGLPAEMFIGSGDGDVVIHAGGFNVADEALRVDAATKVVTTTNDVNVGGDVNATGGTFTAAVTTSSPSVTSPANNEFVTKSYVDNATSAGLHIHAPVLVETTGNLTVTYTQGGTTFDITTISGGNTVTTSVNHGLSVNDQIWLYNTAGNGLSTNTAYFVYSTPALNQLTLSTSYGGIQLTGLTNATGLTYNTRANSGVGAKLTNAGTQVALEIDGVTMALTNRVMVRLQTDPAQNGVYTVTDIGSGSTNWELTRATDANFFSPQDTNGLGEGDYFYTQSGDSNAGDSHVLTTPGNIIIGYTGLTYTQFSGAVTYTGGTNIDVTGQIISLTGTVAATNGGTGTNTVATGDLLYGSATNTWGKLSIGAAYKPLVVNASGTNVEWNGLALNQAGSVSGALPATNGGTGIFSYATGDIIYSDASNSLAKLAGNTSTTKKFLSQTGTGSASQAPSWDQPAASDITGLAASATTDTTNASNITSGTLPALRLSGSYTGITGVGTLSAGTWQASTIAAIYGGTGLTSFTAGDLIYANSSTTLASLADVAVGNALISGGVGADPSWGKIGLATHVDGTLPIANGGTNGSAIPTAGAVAYGTGTAYAFSAAGSSGQALLSGATGAPSWGTLGIASGGSGQTTAQAAMNAFAGSVTSGQYLRGNGSNVVMSTIQAADVPTLNQNTTGSAGSVANALTAGTGITYSSGTTYNGSAAITISIGQAVATSSNVQFNSLGVGTAGSGTAGEIRATNNVTAYYSDDRLKTRLGKIEDALNKLCALEGFYYEANETAQALGYEQVREVGVSAQKMQEVLPEIVAPAPIDDQYLTIRYERALPLIIEAIKELRAELEALKR